MARQAPQRDRLCRAFAADCADRVLPLFEDERPDDARPRRAIAAARSAAANAETEAALAAAFAAATQAGGALRAAARSADDDRARRLRRAATAAEVAADTCRPAPWEAAYDAPIRAATYLFGRDPGLPMGPEWEAETAWQAACLRRHLAWLPEIG
ncbi:MAG: hypothetical protein R3F55_12885 [Alphaproteobacteria bacterium]